jgi:two-component system response regulator AtoC
MNRNDDTSMVGVRRLSVLVVDDNRGTRNALELWLTRLGLNSILCGDAEEGLLRLGESMQRGEPVEVILTDQVLPGLTGLDLIRRCQGLLPNIKAVLITAYQSEELRRQARQLPNCRFLDKPFTPEDLRRTFKELERADAS